MLSFQCQTTAGDTVELKSPLCLNITEEEGVPADSVSVLFALIACPELVSFEIESNGVCVFRGIIDEQERVVGADGAFLRLSGRSMAALLLDNESVPVTYNHPTAGLIYERHVKPFGITTGSHPDSAYFSEMVITKGESNWQAVNRFSQNTFSAVPRVSSIGELSFEGIKSGKEVRFSDTKGDILYSSLEEHLRRCEEISAVNIKVTNSSGYHARVENTDAIDRGIKRERYLNAVLTDTPMNRADKLMKSGRSKGYQIKLRCEDRILDMLGASASVSDSVIGEIKDLYVSALSYRLSPSEEYTTLVLKRRNS